MYRLVRGRETSKAEPDSKKKTKSPTTPSKPPVTEPIAAWSSNVPTHRSLLERFGPAAAVLALIAILGWTAARSLKSEPEGNTQALNSELTLKVVDSDTTPETVFPAKTPEKTVTPPKATAPAEVTPSTDAMAKADATKEENKPEEVGQFEAISGVVLRPGADPGVWDRVEAKAPLKEGLRLLNLAPFRNTLKLGKSEVDLVESSDVSIDDAEKDQPPRLELRRGKVVVRPGSANVPVAIRFEGQILSISAPAGSIIGVERTPTLLPGQAEPAPARLRVYIPDGRVVLKSGELEETLNGPAEISLQISGKFDEKSRQPIPAWVTETTPSVYNKEVGNQFVTLLRPGRSILADLAEAMDDPVKDVKRMAVYALGAIGATEQVIEVVMRKEAPPVHDAGLEVLRSGLAQGGNNAKAIRDYLGTQYDHPWAERIEKMIIGFSPDESKDELTIVKLIEYLSTAPFPGARQLALDHLRTLLNRDNLEYDPYNPDPKALKAWQDLVRKKEPGKEARPGGPGNR
jgi:hypothetical protein